MLMHQNNKRRQTNINSSCGASIAIAPRVATGVPTLAVVSWTPPPTAKELPVVHISSYRAGEISTCRSGAIATLYRVRSHSTALGYSINLTTAAESGVLTSVLLKYLEQRT